MKKLKIQLELVWWAATFLIAAAVLFFISRKTANYPFFWQNAGFIVAAITLARWTFQIEHTFFAKNQTAKIALTIVVFPLAAVLIGGLNGFMTWIADHDFDSIFGHLGQVERLQMENFVWSEMIFWGMAGIIGCGAFLVRLIISLWRTHNLGTA